MKSFIIPCRIAVLPETGGKEEESMTFNKVMFSSVRMDWETPDKILIDLNKEFGELFDPCPIEHDLDMLKVEWNSRNFINPPYGREIGKWLEKGYKESLKGKLCVFLIPSRTDTKWLSLIHI